MNLKRLVMLLFVCTWAASLAACGGNGKGTTKTNEEKLVGSWAIDTDATIKMMEAEATTEEQKAAVQFATQMMSALKMQFEFTADGKMKLTMPNPLDPTAPPEVDEGTYKVKSSDGNSMVVTGTMKDDTKDVTVVFISDDAIEMVMPDEGGPGKLRFTRVKQQ